MKKFIIPILIIVATVAGIWLGIRIALYMDIVQYKTEAYKTWHGEYLQVLINPFTEEETLQGWGDEVFGIAGIRPSNFKTTLANGLDATASTSETIAVSSMTTKDSHTLVSDDIGDFICFHINAGASNDEICCCTGISGTSFTGCTRGYNFYSTGTTSGNAKPHSAGETVVISNDDQYLTTQYPSLDGTATITGLWTFGSTDSIASIQFGPGNTTYDKRMYIYNGDTDKAYLGYDESENAWVVSNNGVDTIAIAGTGGGYTGGDGLLLTASDFSVNIGSASGLTVLSTDSLAIYSSTSNPLYIDDDGQVGLNSSASYAFGSLTLITPLDETYGGTGSSSWDKYSLVMATSDNTLGTIASGIEDYLLTMTNGQPQWAAGQRVLGYQYTAYATPAGTAENVAYTYTIPAGFMSTNGAIRIHIRGVSNSATTNNHRIDFGGTAVVSHSFPGSLAAEFEQDIIVANRNSASSQIYFGTVASTSTAGSSEAGAIELKRGTAAINTANDVIINIIVQNESSDTTGTIDYVSIESIR